jgi:hypothetical protein
MSEQDTTTTIRSWLRDRADTAPDPMPIVATVMADLDRVPQRAATPWRRLASALGSSRVAQPWLPARRWAPTTILVILALVLLAVAALLLAGTFHRPTPLGGPFAEVRSATWSPDGKRLAFYVFNPITTVNGNGVKQYESPKSLYVMNADGSGVTYLRTSTDASPVPALLWSPDGGDLLLTSTDPAGQDLDVRVVPLDGRSTVDIGRLFDPKWSPVANEVEGVTPNGEVVVVRADGSNRRVVVGAKANDVWWSTDGRLLLVTVGDQGSEDMAIWIVPADGSRAREMRECSGAGGASWSHLANAVVCWRAGTQDLIAVTPDGAPARLTEMDRVGFGQMSPDRSGLVTPNLQPGIAIIHPDDSTVRLTTDPHDAYPAFSADGAFVSFWGNRPEGTGLFVVPSTGGTPKLVGRDATIQWSLASPWQPNPDGPQRFAFIRGRSIITVAADGSDPRAVLPEDAAAAVRGDDPRDEAVDDRIVVLADGPERAVYRIGPNPDAAFTVDNRSDDPWVVGLWDDIGAGSVDCGTATPVSSISGQLASIGSQAPPSRPALDFVPVTCQVAPHSSARIKDVGFVPRGTLEVHLYHVAPALGVGTLSRTIWLEFSPP